MSMAVNSQSLNEPAAGEVFAQPVDIDFLCDSVNSQSLNEPAAGGEVFAQPVDIDFLCDSDVLVHDTDTKRVYSINCITSISNFYTETNQPI